MNKLFKSRSAQLFLNCRLVILANFEGLRDYVWFNFKRFYVHLTRQRHSWYFLPFNPGAPGFRNTGGAGCWQQLPFSTFKADFERHRKDSDKRFFPKLAGAVF